MNKGDLLNMIVRYAKEYRKSGIMESVKRNNHMNKYSGENVSHEVADAILVDFVNFVGVNQGMDLGMYTDDLED